MHYTKVLFAIFISLILLYFSYALLFTEHYDRTTPSEIIANKIDNSQGSRQTYKAEQKIAEPDIENELISKKYQKNGITYFESPNQLIHGGFAQNYQQLKLEADRGNAQSAYLLGVNLSKCLSAPTDSDEAKVEIESSLNVLPQGSKNHSKIVSSLEDKTMQDYYYCEGIPLEERAEFYKYIKQSIASGNIYAASSHLDFYGLVKQINKHESTEVQEKILNEYVLEYRSAMKSASEHGSLPAILHLAQSYIDEYSVSNDINSMVEALKYYIVFNEYADSEFQSNIQKRIDSQMEFLTQQEVSTAEAEAKKLKIKIDKNKTIYKMNSQIN